MAGYPPPYPPPVPPPGYDPRQQRRYMRDQVRAQARAQRDAYRAQREQFRYQMRGMRRGSILGPIILIAVGIVFLLIQTGRFDRSHFWNWYGHWWPILLVAAGCAVLVEWVVDQYLLRDPQRPPYRRALGGGVTMMLILLAFTGVIASNFHDYPSGYSKLFPGMHIDQDSFDEFFGDKHESDQTMDLALNAGNSLVVVNPRGDITVSGTSDDSRVHIAIHKQVYSHSDSDADSKAQRLAPATNTEGSTVYLTMPSMEGARADLVIQVPATAATTITANHGDIHATSIKAAVSATANHGDVELSAISGAATVHVNSGSASISARNMDSGVAIQGRAEDITLTDVTGPVSINGEFFGTTHLEHVNGGIHFHTSRTDFQLARLDGEVEISPDANLSADQVLGPVVLTTHGRNIRLDRVAGDIAVTNRDGTIDVIAAPAIGNITVENRNGPVKVSLPEHAGFSVQADTSDGDMFTDFALSNSSSGNRKTSSGIVSGGGSTIRLTTTNADISILKGDAPPIPPTPPAPPKITLAPPAAPATPKAAKAPKAPAPPSLPSN
jgi:DUF4097 and DUF4098 domain-containing protein YvlB